MNDESKEGAVDSEQKKPPVICSLSSIPYSLFFILPPSSFQDGGPALAKASWSRPTSIGPHEWFDFTAQISGSNADKSMRICRTRS